MEGSPANFNEGDDQQTQHLILSQSLIHLLKEETMPRRNKI